LKTFILRLGVTLVWIGLGILAAVLYGILNDQITVTLSPEYFSVYKQRQFAFVLEQTGLLGAPTRVQALLVGTLATWWFGLFLGIVLSICSMVGRRPPLTTRDYVCAILGIMLCTLGISILFGSIAYIAEPSLKPNPDDWPFLEGIHEVRRAFAVGGWHDGAYLGGFLGTILAGLWAQRRRALLAKANDTSALIQASAAH
jgi:hypothetical protein